MGGLFTSLPCFPGAVPTDELRLLASLEGCDWPTYTAIDETDHAAARRLAARGLIKISRQKDDPAAHYPTWYVGRLPDAGLREVQTDTPTGT